MHVARGFSHCASATSQLRHNERDGVSNHRRLDCWLNRLFSRTSKNTSKLRVTGFVRETTGDRWIPLIKGQPHANCFHAIYHLCYLYILGYFSGTEAIRRLSRCTGNVLRVCLNKWLIPLIKIMVAFCIAICVNRMSVICFWLSPYK